MAHRRSFGNGLFRELDFVPDRSGARSRAGICLAESFQRSLSREIFHCGNSLGVGDYGAVQIFTVTGLFGIVVVAVADAHRKSLERVAFFHRAPRRRLAIRFVGKFPAS